MLNPPEILRPSLLVLLTCLSGCTDSLLDRSLVFSTHTTVGIEMSVSPVETGSPVTLVMGYKRFEGVLNPVYHSEGVKTDGSAAVKPLIERYRPKAYSVIAKLSGEVTANGGNTAEGTISGGQWFATGPAAENLSVQPGIAGAVSGNAKIAEATGQASAIKPELAPQAALILTTITTVFDEIGKTDPIAKSHNQKLNQLTGDFMRAPYLSMPGTYRFTAAAGANPAKLDLNAYTAPSAPYQFSTIIRVMNEWEDSYQEIDKALAIDVANLTVNPNSVTTPGIATTNDWSRLVATRDAYKSAHEAMRQDLLMKPAVKDAVSYYVKITGIQ